LSYEYTPAFLLSSSPSSLALLRGALSAYRTYAGIGKSLTFHAAQRRIKSDGSPEWRKKALGGLVAPGNRAAGRISNFAEPCQGHVSAALFEKDLR